MALPPSYANHARRAVEFDGTTHAARYAGDREHFTTACAAYPAPDVERLESTPTSPVTCTSCIDVLEVNEGGIR